jgi:Tetratricopeptide repeat
VPRDRWSEDRPERTRPPRDESRPRIQRDDARPRFDREDSRQRFDRDDRSRGGRSSYGDRRDRPPTPEEQERIDAERIAKSRGWGGVARKGAVHIKSTGGDFQSPREMTPDNRRPDEWIMDDRPSAPAKPKMTSARKPYQLPQDIVTEIRRVFQGSAFQREKMVTFMSNAAEAYDRHRYEEALRLAKTVAEAVPTVAPVLELAGLAAYRAERFPMARKHLRMAFEITGDAQHLPLVMDCERAARRYTLVEGTFSQLVESEPTVEVLAEGRIVMAASLADQKRFQESIDLLIKSGGSKILRNPSGRHVRMWYALADVYDRAGDVASARELFARVVAVDPEAYDAIARLGDLGGTGTVRKNRKKRTTPVSKKKNID